VSLSVGASRRLPSNHASVVGYAKKDPPAESVRERRDGGAKLRWSGRLTLALDDVMFAFSNERT
jgi:hypothetical protein